MTLLLCALLQQGCSATEDQVHRVLLYLARHQNDDGSWGRPPQHCTCPTSCPIDVRLPVIPDADTRRRFQAACETFRSDVAADRERAEKEIYGIGIPVIPLLQDSRDHPDPEIRWRCRDTLSNLWSRDPLVRSLFRKTVCPGTEDLEIKATSLALLTFLGAGYSPLSKDQRFHPMDPSRSYHYGEIAKRGIRWLLDRQKEDGSFGAIYEHNNLFAALALTEIYGMTAAGYYQEPATRAILYAHGLKTSDPDSSLWKEFVFQSAESSEILFPKRDREATIRSLEDGRSMISVAATVIVSAFARKPCDAAKARFLDLQEEHPLPEERYVAMLALNRVYKNRTRERGDWNEAHPSQWRTWQTQSKQCDWGTWRDAPASYEPRLLATIFAGLTMEQFYDYTSSLFRVQ